MLSMNIRKFDVLIGCPAGAKKIDVIVGYREIAPLGQEVEML